MDDTARETPEHQQPRQNTKQVAYVMLVVLIICGGNGVGIITAALIWKSTHLLAAAIVSVSVITILALLGGIIMIVRHNRALN